MCKAGLIQFSLISIVRYSYRTEYTTNMSKPFLKKLAHHFMMLMLTGMKLFTLRIWWTWWVRPWACRWAGRRRRWRRSLRTWPSSCRRPSGTSPPCSAPSRSGRPVCFIYRVTILVWNKLLMTWNYYLGYTIQSGAATCRKCFVICFLCKFPLLAWAAWHPQYSPTACWSLKKHITKSFLQVAAPECSLHM